MPNAKFVYLASQSPRRRQLLEQLSIRYELLLADENEDAEALEVVLPNEAPRAYVQRVTLLKLEAALARMKRRGLPLAPVLCSDTTVALAGKLKHWQLEADDVALVIGGPDGLCPEFKKQAHERIRISDLTLPHAMVRVLLVEQLYRAWSINANHPYHRE